MDTLPPPPAPARRDVSSTTYQGLETLLGFNDLNNVKGFKTSSSLLLSSLELSDTKVYEP